MMTRFMLEMQHTHSFDMLQIFPPFCSGSSSYLVKVQIMRFSDPFGSFSCSSRSLMVQNIVSLV